MKMFGIVVVLLGASCLMTPCWQQAPQGPAIIAFTKSSIAALEGVVQVYTLTCGAPPTQSQGIGALITDPGTPGWCGPYIGGETVPLDPWGTPFGYQLVGTNVLIKSAGPDMTFGTTDDI